MIAIVLMRSVATVALALVAAGCTKSSSSGTCGGGGPICYDVPSGFTQKGEPVKRPDLYTIAFVDEGKAKVEFIARDLDGFDGRWRALQGNARLAKAADAKEEDFADGKGKLLTYTTPEAEPRFIVATMLRGAKKSMECVGEYRTSAPKKGVVDACRSIREP